MGDKDDFQARLLDELYDGVYAMDRRRRITYWNRGAQRMTGFSPAQVVGRRCADRVLCHTDAEGQLLCAKSRCPAVRAMRFDEAQETEIYFRHADGHRVPIKTRVQPLHDDEGNVVGAVEIFSDISDSVAQRALIEQLEARSLLDELTGLGNRRQADRAVADRLGELDRYGWPFGLLFIDIDRFKSLNDTYGHAVGDEALVLVARTLRNAVRGFDTVARWGGEEIVIVLTNVTAEQLRAKAETLRALVAQSALTHDGHEISVTVSLGATMARRGERAEQLVERADALMYQSKQGGRNRVSCD
ncbi:MAG: sensor domain-containing diguanylate cyclase [Myxococcales bacterium]|nr:sensor domain-containing diguanylate cyclase [Myxococcales bacterium]